MKKCLTRGLALAALGSGLAVWPVCPAGGQTTTNGPASSSSANEEKEACIKNLKVIYKAIQAYQLDHKELPNWLSDLVPQYLSDPNVLVCPVSRRTGKTEGPPLADPKISSSYLFEFNPLPLGNTATNAPTRTRRDWKRRQMGLVGSVVPIVRCRLHPGISLNLAFDGDIYEAPGMWEMAFTNRVSAGDLTAAKLFADDPPPPPRPATRYPVRDPKAGAGLIDLTKFYNADLTAFWQGGSDNLAALPKGLQSFANVQFDVRGIIQLAGKSITDKKFPPQVKTIPVHQKCKHLHFLHATGPATASDEGNQVGSYFIHFVGNPGRLEIPIQYGREVRSWHPVADESTPSANLAEAWTNGGVAGSTAAARLFKMTWTNLVPDTEIESIDFVSNVTGPAPFLVAITAD
jgi:hypothetical protein